MSFFQKLIKKVKGVETKDEKIKKTRYEIEEKIYSSRYSKLYKAKIRETNKQICVKIYLFEKTKNSPQEAKILTEISILRRIDHPCLLGCLNVFITPKKSILEMEYMNGGDLYDYLTENGVQSEETVKKISQRLISGIKYLHSVNIIHRDIKLENILLQNKNDIETMKLTDFSLSIELENDILMTEQVGTCYYMAPEIFRKQPYGSKIDCWSAGIVIYSLLCGVFPFSGENNELVKNILKGKFNYPPNIQISETCKDFVGKLICTNPTKRASSYQAMNHAFLEGKEIVGRRLSNHGDMKNCRSESLMSHISMTSETNYDDDDDFYYDDEFD